MDTRAKSASYELQEFLGGGMSHVYRARDTLIRRTVAVRQDSDYAGLLRILKLTGRLSGRSAHGREPHQTTSTSCTILAKTDRQRPFMVMEFPARRGSAPTPCATDTPRGALRDLANETLAGRLARALEYVHTQKIIHRDLKPENIHINTAGVVKLIICGIARPKACR